MTAASIYWTAFHHEHADLYLAASDVGLWRVEFGTQGWAALAKVA